MRTNLVITGAFQNSGALWGEGICERFNRKLVFWSLGVIQEEVKSTPLN